MKEKKQQESKEAFILAEYNSLRSEILSHTDASNQLYMFAFTAVSAVYLLAYHNEQANFYLAAYMILILSRCRMLYYHEMTFKISEYIILFIERREPELNWETTARKTHKISLSEMFLYNLGEMQYFTFTMMGILTFFIYLYISGQNFCLNKQNIVSVAAISILIFLDCKMRFGASKLRKKYRKQWIESKYGLKHFRDVY